MIFSDAEIEDLFVETSQDSTADDDAAGAVEETEAPSASNDAGVSYTLGENGKLIATR